MFLNVDKNNNGANSLHNNPNNEASLNNNKNNNKPEDIKIKNIISNEDFYEDFIIIERSNELKKKKFTPLGTPGKGLNLLGKICSFTRTTFLKISDQLNESKNPLYSDPSNNLLKEGSLLNSLDVQNYISSLIENSEKQFHFILDFLSEQNAINRNSLDEIINCDSIQDLLKKKNTSIPIVIPMIIARDEIFSLNHIVNVIIKNNTVRYFDSKGKFSQYVPIEANKTVRDVLEFFKENFTNNGKIVENPELLQLDSNNCGVFICRDMHSQLVQNMPVDEFSDIKPSFEDLKLFRQHMLEEHERVNQKYLLKQWEQQRQL